MRPSIPPRPNLREKVYQILRQDLLEITANASTPVHIREVELARSLGVSRTPVREALNRLQQEGLVAIVPHKGIRVIPRSLDEYLAWLEVREVLDGLAARLAARRGNDLVVAQMRGIFSQFATAELGRGTPEYAKANAKFHALVIEQSGNQILKRLAQLYDHMGMTGFRMIERLARAQQSLREHLAIIDAIGRKDADEAERLARRHVQQLWWAASHQLGSLVVDSEEAELLSSRVSPSKSGAERSSGATRARHGLRRSRARSL